jgi:phosphoribosylamine-glycine ligase
MSDSDSTPLTEWQPSQPRKRSALPGSGDLSRRLMDDMDPEVLEFLKTTVNSFIKWDLVIFFFENPHTTDTIDNVARYIGRDAAVIKPDLEDLVRAGVLDRHVSGTLAVFSLTKDAAIREKIKHFVSASDDRQFRVKAIYHLVRGTR